MLNDVAAPVSCPERAVIIPGDVWSKNLISLCDQIQRPTKTYPQLGRVRLARTSELHMCAGRPRAGSGTRTQLRQQD